jgi:Flp pilus assembly protein TadD
MLRRSLCLRGLALASLLVVSIGPGALAQERISIEGDVKLEHGSAPNQRLEAILMTNVGAEVERVFTSPDGTFSFFNVTPGDYRIVVKAPYKGKYKDGTAELTITRTFATQIVSVSVVLEPIQPRPLAGPKGGTVAVEETQAAIPREARKHYESGTKAAAAGYPEAAVGFFRRALEIEPNYLFALNDLGAQLIKLDKIAEAMDVLRKAIALAPRSYSPHMNLAVALLSSGKPVDARSEIAVALDLQPDDANAHYVSGQVEMALGNREPAIKAFDRALLFSNGRLVATLIHLGKLYEETGNVPKAIEAYRTYLSAAATGPAAAFARERLEALGAAGAP